MSGVPANRIAVGDVEAQPAGRAGGVAGQLRKATVVLQSQSGHRVSNIETMSRDDVADLIRRAAATIVPDVDSLEDRRPF